MAQAGCQICQDLTLRQFQGEVILISEQDLMPTDPPTNVKLSPSKKRDFLTKLGAAMNEGGGVVIIHGLHHHKLDLFHQSVDGAMASLIPDDSAYPDNFERHLNKDNHVVIRVIPRERPLSTYCFHTKISYNKGVEDPTHGQIRYYMTLRHENEDSGDVGSVNYDLRYNKEARVRFPRRTMYESFQESISMQAKKINSFDYSDNPRVRMENLLDQFFRPDKPGCFLPKYISAFAKLGRGGSIFLGIEEGKRMVQGKEIDTGVSKCQGVALSPNEKRILEENIKRYTELQMYWHSSFSGAEAQSDASNFRPPVEVIFHPVKMDEFDAPNQDKRESQKEAGKNQDAANRDRVVVEVKVGFYDGLAFTRSKGPEAYRYIGQSLIEIDKDDWFEQHTQKLCQTCFGFRHIPGMCSCHR